MTPHDDDIGSQPTQRISSSESAPELPTASHTDGDPATDPMVGRMVGTIRLTGVLGCFDGKLGRSVA